MKSRVSELVDGDSEESKEQERLRLEAEEIQRKIQDARNRAAVAEEEAAAARAVYDAATMRPPPPTRPATRIMSWNVNGIRAVLNKASMGGGASMDR